MAVLKEWNCIEHGDFESTHPICPNFGCDSRHVQQVYITPPKLRSDKTKRFDAGIRKSADMMHLSDLRSVKEGEAAFGGDVGKELGQELLWGQEDVKKKLGHNVSELIAAAQQPLTVTKKDGSTETLTQNNAMAQAATELGITRRVLPKPGEITIVPSEEASVKAARRLQSDNP